VATLAPNAAYFTEQNFCSNNIWEFVVYFLPVIRYNLPTTKSISYQLPLLTVTSSVTFKVNVPNQIVTRFHFVLSQTRITETSNEITLCAQHYEFPVI